jgi:hypothetical protein
MSPLAAHHLPGLQVRPIRQLPATDDGGVQRGGVEPGEDWYERRAAAVAGRRHGAHQVLESKIVQHCADNHSLGVGHIFGHGLHAPHAARVLSNHDHRSAGAYSDHLRVGRLRRRR